MKPNCMRSLAPSNRLYDAAVTAPRNTRRDECIGWILAGGGADSPNADALARAVPPAWLRVAPADPAQVGHGALQFTRTDNLVLQFATKLRRAGLAEKTGELFADLSSRLAQRQTYIHAGADARVADRAAPQPLLFECHHGVRGAVRDLEGPRLRRLNPLRGPIPADLQLAIDIVRHQRNGGRSIGGKGARPIDVETQQTCRQAQHDRHPQMPPEGTLRRGHGDRPDGRRGMPKARFRRPRDGRRNRLPSDRRPGRLQ